MKERQHKMSDLLITLEGDLLDYLETGLDFLGSVVTDNLLNEIMSDLYAPDFGTDLSNLPSTNLDNQKDLEMKIVLALENVERRIKREQDEYPSNDDNEMLETLKLYDLYETETGGIRRWKAIIRVVSISGKEKEIEFSK